LAAALFFSTFIFSGCGESKELVFIVPDGGALLPAAKLFSDAPAELGGGYRVQAEIVTGLTAEARLNAGTCDAAVAPINLCAKVYNETGNYVLAGVVSWGNNYIVSFKGGGNPEDLAGLYGEVLYAFGATAVPGVTLRHILGKQGVKFAAIDDPSKPVAGQVNLYFLPSLDALNTEINRPSSAVKYAFLAEPAVTARVMSGAAEIMFDIQALYAGENGARYPQAGLVIKKSLLESSPKTVDALLVKMAESAAYCLNNPAETANLAKETLQSSALPALNVTKAYIESERGQSIMAYGPVKDAAVRQSVGEYLTIIMGDKAPDDGFYLKAA